VAGYGFDLWGGQPPWWAVASATTVYVVTQAAYWRWCVIKQNRKSGTAEAHAWEHKVKHSLAATGSGSPGRGCSLGRHGANVCLPSEFAQILVELHEQLEDLWRPRRGLV
jgi:hypothetical protein